MEHRRKIRVLRAIPGSVEAFEKRGFEEAKPLKETQGLVLEATGENIYQTRLRPHVEMDELAGEGLVEVKVFFEMEVMFTDAPQLREDYCYVGSYAEQRETIAPIFQKWINGYYSECVEFYARKHNIPWELSESKVRGAGFFAYHIYFTYRRTEAGDRWLEENESVAIPDVSPSKTKSYVERKTYPTLDEILEWLPMDDLPEDGVPIAGWVDVEKAVKIAGVKNARSLNTMRNKPTAEKMVLENRGVLFRDASGRIAFRPEGSQSVLYWLETLRNREKFWKKVLDKISHQAKTK